MTSVGGPDTARITRRAAIRRPGQRVVVAVLSIATVFMVIVDSAVANVALPSIGRQFHLAPSGLNGVIVVYPVAVAVTVPASAWLCDRLGGRRVLLGSLGLFVVLSALCGAASSLPELVVFRALQGMAGGVLTPVAGTLLFRTFPAHERARVSQLSVVPQQVAPALAPILGGFLTDTFSWRWVFYVNLPFGLAALVFGLLFLDAHQPPRPAAPPGRFDLPGLLLCALGLASLTYGISAGATQGWSAPSVLVPLVTGALALAAAVVTELRASNPVLRLRLYANRSFRDFNLVSFLGTMPFMGAMFLGPLFIQEVRGGSAFDSGSSTFTEAFGILLTVQLIGRRYGRIGPRLAAGGGLLGVTAVLLLLSGCGPHTSLWTFRLLMFLLGLAMGAVFMPTNLASLSTVSTADMSQASTLNTVLRQLSMALGPALVSTVLVADGVHAQGGGGAFDPPVGAYQATYRVLAGLCLAAGLFALTRDDEEAKRAARGRTGSSRTTARPSGPAGPRTPHRPVRDTPDTAPSPGEEEEEEEGGRR
jgi:EmrB/QacA subfamily drug resistance transporter